MSAIHERPQLVDALHLRKVTLAQCALAGLLRSGVAARFDLAGEAAEVGFRLPPAPPQLTQEAIVLMGSFGRLVIDNGTTLLRVLTAVDIGVVDERDDPTRAWLLQQALGLLPEFFSDLIGRPFEIGDTSVDDSDSLAWADAYLRAGTSGVRFRVGADVQTWNLLLAHGGLSPLPVTALDCQFRLNCVVGRCVLPASAVRALAVGDAILAQSELFTIDGEGIIHAGRRAMRGRIDVVDGQALFQFMTWEAAMSSKQESDNDAVPAAWQASDADRGLDDFADVPITITFDLGHVALTYQEANALVPGCVLVIDTQAIPPNIVVRANGARIGYGTLVDVNGRLAVQIASVFRSA
jgi:type III secretion system YscQ/HrcQ family protein